MEPRKEESKKVPQPRKDTKQRRLQIVKLEPRITPGLSVNHNETLVRDAAQTKSQRPQPRKNAEKRHLQMVKLEPRITPGKTWNHNETLVRDAASKGKCQ